MTDQQDQAALNGLVNDCYGGEWPWQENDYAHCLGGPEDQYAWHVSLVYKEEGSVMLRVSQWFDPQLADKYRPYAGTWVEGRLRELIMAIERIKSVHINDYGKLCTIEVRLKALPWRLYYQRPTPITVLVAALRVLKQKEGNDAV